MSVKVFIDGQEGTTGLKILERFEGRTDIELIKIDEDKRKDVSERKRLINASDFTFLCLPDIAAKESVSLVENRNVKIIDASTAHRTNPLWAYGFPELSPEHRLNIKNSSRVAVPGCYASGFISLIYPLIKSGAIPPYYPAFCYAISGYSGAGKKAIAQYEDENRDSALDADRLYALSQQHKHLPEMQKISGLAFKPMFNPIISPYYSGMIVNIPIQARLLSKKLSLNDAYKVLKKHYEGQNFIEVIEPMATETLPDGFMPANAMSDTNKMQIFVCGNDEQILLSSRFDNLGKGASGAAVQCLNIMMGIDETTGLI